MASFFQLLRDSILNRAFIIFQRPAEEHVEDSQDESSDDEGEVSENEAVYALEEKKGEEDADTDAHEGSYSHGDRTFQTKQSQVVTENKEIETDTTVNEDPKSPPMENVNKVAAQPKIEELKESKVDLESYYSSLKTENCLDVRCASVLNLAICLSKESPGVEMSECLAVLKYLSDSANHPHLAVCHSLLLCAFTKMPMSPAEMGLLEERIVSLAETVKKKDLSNSPKTYKIEALSGHHNEMSLQLCQKLFAESYLELQKVDISTICCSSLNNLSTIIKQHDGEVGAYSYRNSTIKYILGMTGKSTKETICENLKESFQNHCPTISNHRTKLCLQVLEHALSINPDLSYGDSLSHENFSLPQCLTRLLGWSAVHVFTSKSNSDEDVENFELYFKFHHSTLVCILKILSVLTFNPEMYDTFPNVKGLMEKILICNLKAYFESEKNNFDIQVLCLEMLINLYIKNQNTFVLLCLKKFKISESEEVLAVEALLKMLSDYLRKIKEVKEAAPYSQAKKEQEVTSRENTPTRGRKNMKDKATQTPPDSEEVLQAASKDMEHSTIVSFICVLIVFFMRTKQNFKEFIMERITSEAIKEATVVSKKFLEFASLTGGMPVTGILILSQTINKLQQMQS